MPSNLGDLIAFLIGRTALVLLVVLPAMWALSTVIRRRRTQTDHPGRSSRYVASTLASEGEGPSCGWRCRYARMKTDQTRYEWVCRSCGRRIPCGREDEAPWCHQDHGHTDPRP